MAGSPIKRERRARTEKLLADPATIDMLCGRIAGGETLAAISKELDVKFRDLTGWIEADPERRKRYREALDVREKHHKDRVVDELMVLLNVDVLAAFNEDGSFKPLDKIPENVRKWIAGMEVEELYDGKGENKVEIGRLRKIKLWDKMRGVEMMAKHLKMLVEKHEHTGKLTLADLLSDEGEKK